MAKRKHYLLQIKEAVDKSHPDLGNLVAAETLAVKSRKMFVVVAPRGTGKSRASNFVGYQSPKRIMVDRLSAAGLSKLTEELTGFKGAVVVDDIAKAQTSYARITTITTLAELVYGHSIRSSLSKLHYDIEDFHGSVIVNIQPVLLRAIVQSPEWEASIADKSIRYYHLKRPLGPNPSAPEISLDWGESIEEVTLRNPIKGLIEPLERIVAVQWGRSRVREHIGDLLKAAAALDKRKRVNESDYTALLEILKPLLVEELVLDKKDFESDRFVYSARLALMTELATYGQFTINQVSEDYKVSVSQAYRLMNAQIKDWVIVAQHPTSYAPSETLKAELNRVGVI